MGKVRCLAGVVALVATGCTAPRTVELPANRAVDAGVAAPAVAEIKVDVVTLPMPQSPPGAACSMNRIASLENAILDQSGDTRARVTSTPWDHTSSPARLDRLTERFAL